jgi:hypothetical protein
MLDAGQAGRVAVVQEEAVPSDQRATTGDIIAVDDEELADWRAGRNAVYQLAVLTIGSRLAVADA